MFRNNAIKNLYYNINVSNKQDIAVPLRYADTRNNAIVDNLDNYQLSILRFQMDLSEIPLMVYPTAEFQTFQQNQAYNTPDNTAWSITIDQGTAFPFVGTVAQEFVVFEDYGRKSVNNSVMPVMYDFYHLCNLLNKAIKRAGVVVVATDKLPYFSFNKETSSIDFVAPEEYKQDAVGHRSFYVNKGLYDLFCSDYSGQIVNLSNGRYYEIFVYGTGDNFITTQKTTAPTLNGSAVVVNPGAFPGFTMRTYYPNLGKLVAIRSIVFTSSTIPTINEYITENNDLDAGDSGNKTIKALKDFEISLGGADAVQALGINNFVIASEFQMIQLKSGGEPLNNLDLQAFWRDKHGSMFPVYLPVGSSFTMKMLFRLL